MQDETLWLGLILHERYLKQLMVQKVRKPLSVTL